MTVQTKATLKGYFNIGDYPSEANFRDLIDSFFAVNGDVGGAERKLGNTDNYALSFITNNLTRIYINNNGNVLIGNNSFIPHKLFNVIAVEDGEKQLIQTSDSTIGKYTGLLFKVSENNDNAYRKGGVLFERTKINSVGRMHLVNNVNADANNATLSDAKLTIEDTGNIGIGISSSIVAKLHIVQSSVTEAIPVLILNQMNIDEDYLKIIGTSDTSVDRALVDAVNFSTPGSIAGWLKINVQDDQATNPITDGDYYIPFYTAPTA